MSHPSGRSLAARGHRHLDRPRIERFRSADGVVIVIPLYKAAHSGQLKALLDLLSQCALEGVTVLPLSIGGSTAHALAIDYGLRPVFTSMGPAHITPAGSC